MYTDPHHSQRRESLYSSQVLDFSVTAPKNNILNTQLKKISKSTRFVPMYCFRDIDIEAGLSILRRRDSNPKR